MPTPEFKSYLTQIQKHLTAGNATEHTYRAALSALIESAASGVTATNEPKRVKCGAPDYIVTSGQTTNGYIEAKDIGKNLDEVEKSEQMQRYLEALPNLILTDYLEFRLYQDGQYIMTARVAKPDADGKLRKERGGENNLSDLLQSFFDNETPTVTHPRDLAERMAKVGHILHDIILAAFNDEDEEHGTLHNQFEAFKRVLLHDLEGDAFADMYAQTICYGMFAACVNHDPAKGPFLRQAASYDLPETNPFLREMFNYIAGPQLDPRLTWAVEELVQLLSHCDMAKILQDFGKRTRQEDPVVHFYETFLAAYDPRMREARGVYYTPEPVVSYIVRSVDHILKNDFGIKDGLASTEKVPLYQKIESAKSGKARREKVGESHKVLVLDPATGTGTFLHGVIDQIHQQILDSGQSGMWDGYVSKHLLPRLFGFELLMAPYAVAHMKLGMQLAETGYSFNSGERLRVYLTNTLEEAFEHGDLPLFANLIAEEANAAGRVKNESPVMVVLGNPPYSGHSENNSPFIADLLRGKDRTTGKETGNYFEVDGKPLGERNPKWLNDDYVKFIRFSQWRIEQTGYGVLAFISNHGYLDNPTFRGMRQSLMQTFDDIYILDLHGNAKKKETAPDGTKDENVFDIQQGVAIGIFVKHNRTAGFQPAKNGNNAAKMAAVRDGVAAVHHSELYGIREVWENPKSDERKLVGGKYHDLFENDVEQTEWQTIEPVSPFYLFIPQDRDLFQEYEKGWKVTEAIPVNSVGIVTARDKLTIQWSEEEVWETVTDFASLEPEAARDKYGLGRDVQDWKVPLAQKDLAKSGPNKENIAKVLYRPFDARYTYFTGESRGFICRPRSDVMRHMLAGENVGFVFMRQVALDAIYSHFGVSRHIIDNRAFFSNKGIMSMSPLYLYPKSSEEAADMLEMAEAMEAEAERRPNLAPEFIEDLSQRLGMSFIPDGKGNCTGTAGFLPAKKDKGSAAKMAATRTAGFQPAKNGDDAARMAAVRGGEAAVRAALHHSR